VKKDNFNHLMNKYSTEAEEQRLEEARLQARDAKRRKIRRVLGVVLFMTLCTYAIVNHAELQAQITRLLPAKESEYQSIMKVATELEAQKPGDSASGGVAPAGDPASRPARIKQALLNAQQRTAIADSIIDGTPTPVPKKP
jgi:predicted exporter